MTQIKHVLRKMRKYRYAKNTKNVFLSTLIFTQIGTVAWALMHHTYKHKVILTYRHLLSMMNALGAREVGKQLNLSNRHHTIVRIAPALPL